VPQRAYPYDSLIETLTFFSADVEGSPALLRRVGDDVYAKVLGQWGSQEMIETCRVRVTFHVSSQDTLDDTIDLYEWRDGEWGIYARRIRNAVGSPT
jgi:hypothetical protein